MSDLSLTEHSPNLHYTFLREGFSCQLTDALSIPSFNLPCSYIQDTTEPKVRSGFNLNYVRKLVESLLFFIPLLSHSH